MANILCSCWERRVHIMRGAFTISTSQASYFGESTQLLKGTFVCTAHLNYCELKLFSIEGNELMIIMRRCPRPNYFRDELPHRKGIYVHAVYYSESTTVNLFVLTGIV